MRDHVLPVLYGDVTLDLNDELLIGAFIAAIPFAKLHKLRLPKHLTLIASKPIKTPRLSEAYGHNPPEDYDYKQMHELISILFQALPSHVLRSLRSVLQSRQKRT
jgi:hypothetical protein